MKLIDGLIVGPFHDENILRRFEMTGQAYRRHTFLRIPINFARLHIRRFQVKSNSSKSEDSRRSTIFRVPPLGANSFKSSNSRLARSRIPGLHDFNNNILTGFSNGRSINLTHTGGCQRLFKLGEMNQSYHPNHFQWLPSLSPTQRA